MSADPPEQRAHEPAQRSPARLDLVDHGVLAGYLLLAAGFGYLSLESDLRTPPAGLLLLGVLGTASVLIRPRRPVLSFAAAIVLLPATFAVGSGAEAVLPLPALYRAGSAHSARRAWAMFGISSFVGVVAALVLAIRVRIGPPLLGLAPRIGTETWVSEWLSTAALFLGIALIITLLGINVGHRRRLIAALVERADQMQRERDQLASIAGAHERERIAREMHDVIAHSLSVMIALADGAHAAAPQRPEESRQVIGRVAETGRRTLGEVRRLLTTVREGDGAGTPPAPALGIEQLPALVDEFRAAGLPVRLQQRGTLEPGATLGLTVYRIVQESLTNVLRHAQDVRDVLVRVLVGAGEVTVLVEDTSSPALPVTNPGRGLVGIQERAAFYAGHVSAGPRAGGGWRVAVRLPLEER